MLDRYCIFIPKRKRTGDPTPGDVGLEYDDVFFSAAADVTLYGWLVPGKNDMTLLWFHGNGNNISHHVDGILMLHQRLGVNIFIFDYRGYGLSEGKVSERGTYLDAEAALSYLRSRQDVNPAKLVLYGYSLGAAVAVEMATRYQAYAVLLESPFTSIKATARKRHPMLFSCLPVGALVQSRYDSLSKIKDVHSPLMVLHGDRDDIVPYDLGRELFDAANEPKRFYTIAGAGHNDTYLVGGDPYYEALKRFLEAPAGSHG